ncbi:unnamed protein product [Rotaria sordida]|uniref:G-protein coupled receptors family 1 profile domain-containing protein n=2 Tax=Rotaria sordida TaxID=392033 RepID=A0A814XE50_9BILA|nr:unnamed protein product [Rotaria sordida]CAF1214519.1 unnamed protein product [Rotaria sordida]
MDRQYRTTPCTFYFLIGTVHDLLLILIVLGLRLVTVGFGIDLTRMSVVWCKARYYFFCTWAGILLTCQCLATLDQFLVTSKNARLRRLSTIKGAHRAVVVTLIVWWGQCIPWLIYQNISPINGACIYINPIFLRYVIFFGLDDNLFSKEYLIQSTIALLAYLESSARFYLFLIASSRFRQVTKRWICWWRAHTQVSPNANVVMMARD